MRIIRSRQSSDRYFGYNSELTEDLIEHYDSIGPREGDIALAFSLAEHVVDPYILEIGCGLGREASVLVKRTAHYLGIDSPEGMIEKARQRVRGASFEVADPLTYNYPHEYYDMVFSFAILRHYQKQDVATILKGIHSSLKPGGLLYISLAYGEEYQTIQQENRFGSRSITLYNPALIMKLAGKRFELVHERLEYVMGVRWFEIALKRR